MNIGDFLKKGILISPDLLGKDIDADKLVVKDNVLVVDSSYLSYGDMVMDWASYEQAKAKYEKTGEGDLSVFFKAETPQTGVKIIESFEERNTKIAVKDFVNLYNSRYLMLQGILKQRQELASATTIRKVMGVEENETVSFIGMVLEIGLTKNNNIMFTLEDQTGTMKAVITKTNKEMYELAKDVTQDEVIGVQGTKGNNIVFLKSIVLPDVPLNKELKKSPVDEAALFISDIHIGSKAFMEKNFERFIEWLKGNVGNSAQKALVKKVKYLFVIGDIVEGIGIYPDQEKDLSIKDIYDQYSKFYSYMKDLKDIQIFVCPGNHDSLRLAEPQPQIPRELLPEMFNMPNVHFVSSPSTVRIGETEKFGGFDILLYHGFSFPFYADAVESIRAKGGLENTDNIMVFLLKKRHLAPTHGSTQYQLGYDKDPLVIKNVPDFFVTGHIHRASIKNYKNVTLLNCACWIAQTEYQEKRGLVPQPARAIYVDLKTRETKIINFTE